METKSRRRRRNGCKVGSDRSWGLEPRDCALTYQLLQLLENGRSRNGQGEMTPEALSMALTSKCSWKSGAESCVGKETCTTSVKPQYQWNMSDATIGMI